MRHTEQLAFAIHHLNPWGGHDRSTLEIVKRVNHEIAVGVYTYGIEGTQWRPAETHQVRPFIRRPALALTLYFHLASIFFFVIKPILFGKRRPLVHSTGTCSLVLDVVQVQFVNEAWRRMSRSGIGKSMFLPGTRSESGVRWIRHYYQKILLQVYCWIERWLYKNNKVYIAISKSVAEELKTCFGIYDRQIRVIHHGIDANQFAPSPEKRAALRKELGLSENELVILFVGEFERKGLMAAVQTLSKVANPNARLLVLGNGQREGFLKAARDLGCESQLVFVGHAKNPEDFYRASDIFLLPTIYEPFGLVILEAMASGLPCIVSKCAGASELIQDKETGFLISNPMDTTEIASLLQPLLKDRDLRTRIGANARNSVKARSWDFVSAQYLSVLNEVMGATRGSYDFLFCH